MGDKKIYIVAKIFDQQGCLAYLCKTPNEARCLPGTLEALRADGVQIVILDSPEIYSEYAPYTYIEDMKEFIDKVAQMNRVACPARLLRFFFKMPKICAIPIKPLHCKAFRFDGLITPTLKAAGSNPVGHTKMC